MQENSIRSIAIIGGGTAGWMTAAAFSKHLSHCDIRLVESDQIATVGVGEATIPAIRAYNDALEIDEPEFMRETNASFKLGIQFENWRQIGDEYNHAFGYFGYEINDVPFHHYWMKLRQMGDKTRFREYNMPHMAADMNRFAHRQFDPRSVESRYFYAFQFDATLYAQYLRRWSEARGVSRTEGKVVTVETHPETGFIMAVVLESGERVEADLFIDCSGFRGLLISGALGIEFEDWSHWLLCNRAWAVSSTYPEGDVSIPPYTRARALPAGWQWRIPLQHRSGDGHVFSNEHMSEDEARQVLLDNIEGEAMGEPRLLKFVPGRRKKCWHKNCVAIGLAGGFLEPLESTSIYLIQTAIMKLLRSFPDRSINPADQREFNRQMADKYQEARDFLILHYHATERDDTSFWNYTRTMEIPEELRFRLELFRRTGHVAHKQTELFIQHNWLAVLIGQGVIPDSYDPRVDGVDLDQLRQIMHKMKTDVRQAAEAMPTHAATLQRYCADDLITAA